MQIRRGLFFLLAVPLAACATPGAEEFRTYERSFTAAREAASDVVSVYNEYDRANREFVAPQQRFDPDYADVYVPGTLTPYSSQLRHGFAAATVYTEVLARYVDNETLFLQSDNIAALETATTSVAGLAGRAEIGASVGGLLDAIAALLNPALAARDRTEFVAAVRRGTGTVDAFLEEVRIRTTDLYAEARNATRLGNSSREKLADFRIMLASFVLLIDQTRSDLAALTEAVENPDLARPVIGALAESAQRIDAYARRIAVARDDIRGVF